MITYRADGNGSQTYTAPSSVPDIQALLVADVGRSAKDPTFRQLNRDILL
jgi:hypothetical protein